MTLEVITNIGKGGIGMQGQDANSVYSILKEMQGLNVTLVAGAAAGTKMNVAAMRQEDTITAMFDFTASSGAFATVDLSHVTIQETHATGTVTCASAAAADTVTVNGKVYTAVSGTAASYAEFTIAGDDSADAAALAAAINIREKNAAYAVQATVSSNVVTIRAIADGTAGNSIALATSNNTRLAKSGTTLTNGTATGGFKCTDTLHDSVFVVWYNKK